MKRFGISIHEAASSGWRWTFVIASLPVLLALYLRKDVEESKVWEKRVIKAKKTKVKVNIRENMD